MVVKGSKQYRPVVVAHEPGKRLLFVIFSTLVFCALATLCFWLGYQEAQQDHVLALQDWERLQDQVAEQEEQILQLNTQLSNSAVGGNVDKQAMELLRKEILTLKQTIAGLQENNHFYRELIEPSSDNKGLSIGSFGLQPTSKPDQYHYQLLIQQFAKEPRTLTGRATVTLVGTEAGAPRSYALHQVSPEISDAAIPLKFRFYQSLEGKLTLPEGFELTRVDVTTEKQGGSAPITRSFDRQQALQTP